MKEAEQYFTLIGQLDQKRQLTYMPMFRQPRKVDFRDKQSDFMARLLDDAGKPLAEVPVAYARYCSGRSANKELAVRAYLPFFEQTRQIVFEFQKQEVHVLDVSKQRPRVEWATEFPEQINGKAELHWKVEYEGEQPLEFVVRYSHDDAKTFCRLGDRTSETAMVADFAELPGGKKCRLRVVVTDGYNNAEDTSSSFSVGLLPVDAAILSPVDGTTLLPGHPALLVGQAYFLESRESLDGASLLWSSSLQGRLGEGTVLQAQLKPGEHVIRLHAEAGARSAADEIKLNVK
jgi:hypothetical protein